MEQMPPQLSTDSCIEEQLTTIDTVDDSTDSLGIEMPFLDFSGYEVSFDGPDTSFQFCSFDFVGGNEATGPAGASDAGDLGAGFGGGAGGESGGGA